MRPPEDATAPRVTSSEGGNGNHQTAGADHIQDISDQQPIVGAYVACIGRVGSLLHATASARGRALDLIEPGDIEDQVAADAVERIRAAHTAGLDGLELVEHVVAQVEERRRAARQPGDPLPIKYTPCVRVWLADALITAASLPEHSAVLLAWQVSGTGRRRQIAHLAAELARAAGNLEFDEDDVQAAAGRLLPLLGVAS